MPSRRIADLHPNLQPIARAFLSRCETDGLSVIITCTYRSLIEQSDLYARGRTKPGKIVTNAPPGRSRHNNTLNGTPAALAFDVVPLRCGKCIWGTTGNGLDDNPDDDLTDDLEIWQRVGKIGTDLGLTWLGAAGSRLRDFPHFELKL